MFSESDPYCCVIVPGKKDALQTKTIQDEPNPWWDEDFYFDCIEVDGRLEGDVRIELWDENEGNTADILIGHSILDLSAYSHDEWADIELQVTLEPKWQKMLDEARRPKRGWLGFGGKGPTDEEREAMEAKLRPPTLIVSIIGAVPSLNSLLNDQHLSEVENIMIDKETQSVRVPLNDPKIETKLFIGLGFSNTEGLQLIISSASQDCPYYLDFSISSKLYGGQEGKPGDGSIRLERMKWPKGRKAAPRVKIFEEVRLLGLPLNVDLQEVIVTVSTKLPAESQFSVSSLLEWGGFGGPGIPFNKAVKQMTSNGALANTKKQEIYLPPDHEWPPTCLLGLDWKLVQDTAGGICPGLVAYQVHTKGSSLCWEFSLHSSSSSVCEHTIECFSKPIKLRMGDEKLKCKKMLRLNDPGGQMRCDETIGGLLLVGFGTEKSQSYWFLKALLGHDSIIENEEASEVGGQKKQWEGTGFTSGIGQVASKGLGLIGSAGTKIGSGVTEGLSKAGSKIRSVFTGGLFKKGDQHEDGGDSFDGSRPSPSGSRGNAIANKLQSSLSIGSGKKKTSKKKRIEEEDEDY